MKAQHSDLVGLFLVLDSSDHEHYRTGQIVAAARDCYLVRFDKVEKSDDHPLPMELYTGQKSAVCGNLPRLLRSLIYQDAFNEG